MLSTSANCHLFYFRAMYDFHIIIIIIIYFVIKQVQAVTWTQIRGTEQQGT